MKAAICSLFVACFLFAATADALDDWTQKFPDPHPTERSRHAMAYIGGDEVLLFGGQDSEPYYGDTWVYDLSANTWTKKLPVSAPVLRREHAMAYIGGDKALLFGGYFIALNDETWVYDLSANTWTQLSPDSKPSARSVPAMAYVGGDQVLLFGGLDGYGFSDETWVFDLSDTTWTLLSPSPKPSARTSTDMAYVGGDQVLLFGGYDGSANDDTWIFDLSDTAWSQLTPSTKPSELLNHRMAYIGGDQVLLFGGRDGGHQNDTWIFDLSDTAWSQDFNTTRPSPRELFGFSETSMDGSSFPVLFGGYDGSNHLDDTWTYYPVPDTPQVTVAYPNGGETLMDSVIIAWTATDPDPGETALLEVDLDYSADAGTTWAVIDSNQTNDGTYHWYPDAVPDGNNYLVRLTATDTTGLSDSDASDAVFSINQYPDPPQVAVNYPNGGESLMDSVIIDWTATDPDPGEAALLEVDLDYSADAGSTWALIDSNQTNDETYHWYLYALPDGDSYLVRVTAIDTTGLSAFDISDEVFYIDTHPDPPRVTLIYPNGGEILAYSTTITWTATDIDPGEAALLRVDLDYSADAGTTWAVIDSNQTNDGAHLWDISGLPEDDSYLVRIAVADTTGRVDSDTSDGVFTILQPADDWTQQFPDPHPSARGGHDMAYIGEDKVLLFGGGVVSDPYVSDETWVYDLSADAWTEQSPSTKPSGRSSHAMAYTGEDKVLLFGGDSSAIIRDDTWIYDLSETTWTQLFSSLEKPIVPHSGVAMAYIGGDQVLLFGGHPHLDETWVYDLSESTWTQQNPATKPSGRLDHAMAYLGGDEVLLFGGKDSSGNRNDTWVYDLSDDSWTQQSPVAKPSARQLHEMAYMGGDQVILFGGVDYSGYDDETWIYDLSTNTWIQDFNTIQPSARVAPGLCETSMNGSSPAVLFGGFDDDYDDETWIFGGGDYPLPGPPAAISDLTATLADSTIHLSWTAVTADTAGKVIVVDHYDVYRDDDPGFSPGPADSIGSTVDTFYVDSTAAVKDTVVNHYYVVRAIDLGGKKSADSNRVGEFDRKVFGCGP